MELTGKFYYPDNSEATEMKLKFKATGENTNNLLNQLVVTLPYTFSPTQPMFFASSLSLHLLLNPFLPNKTLA